VLQGRPLLVVLWAYFSQIAYTHVSQENNLLHRFVDVDRAFDFSVVFPYYSGPVVQRSAAQAAW
jgi:hypothetical protein